MHAAFFARYLFLLLQLAQFGKEGVKILKFTVNRRKTNISHVVTLLELTHDHFAKLVRGDLLNQRILKLRLDLGDDLLTVDGAFLTGLQDTGKHFGTIEKLLGTVFFYHENLHRFDHFKGGKALLTSQALAAATDAVTLLDRA